MAGPIAASSQVPRTDSSARLPISIVSCGFFLLRNSPEKIWLQFVLIHEQSKQLNTPGRAVLGKQSAEAKLQLQSHSHLRSFISLSLPPPPPLDG